MRTLQNTLYLSLALLVTVTVAACDQGEQHYDIEPGGTDNLDIRGPAEADVPAGTATFQIVPFTIDKEYSWSVEGPGDPSFTRRRSGEEIGVTFEQPGTYTVSIESSGQGDNYSGSTTFVASYPSIVPQAGRFGFGRLGTALDAAGLTDTLGTEGPFTVFAPTNEALVATFDTTNAGDLNMPASNVLADILSYHVVPDSLRAGELSGSAETLEGGELSFNMTGGNVQVIDGTDATNPATVTNANVPTSNGLIHEIDALRLPPTASVALNDQTTEDNVTITVRSVYVPRDGYVAIHDSTLLGDDGEPFTSDDQPLGSVIGVSDYVEAGVYNNLEVTLFDVPGGGFASDASLEENQTLIAMPHEETSGNEEYNFLTSSGSEDGPYFQTVGGDQAVVDLGAITVTEE